MTRVSSIRVSRRCIWGRHRPVFRGDSSGETGHAVKIVPSALPGTGFERRPRQAPSGAPGDRARGVPRLPHPVVTDPGQRPP